MKHGLIAAICTLALIAGPPAHAQPAGASPAGADAAPNLVMVRVYVADMAKSEHFYEQVLDMRLLAARSEREHVLTFPGANGGPGLLLTLANREKPELNGGIVVRVGDVDARLARAVALGASVVRPSRAGPMPNSRDAIFTDLDGSVIQIAQFQVGDRAAR